VKKITLTISSFIFLFSLLVSSHTAAAATCTDLKGDIESGMSGLSVTALQLFLTNNGYLPQLSYSSGAGTFGVKTESAVQLFQRKYGISPTGYVGASTRAAIRTVSCGSGATYSAAPVLSKAPTQAATTPQAQATITNKIPGISLSIETTRRDNSYGQNEIVRVSVKAMNVSQNPISITFAGSCDATYTIDKFSLKNRVQCTATPYKSVLTPGAILSWGFTYDPQNYGQLTKGKHALTITVGPIGTITSTLTTTDPVANPEPSADNRYYATVNTPPPPSTITAPSIPIAPGAPRQQFAIFDGLVQFTNKPPTFLPGLTYTCMMQNFYQNDVPNEALTRAQARGVGTSCKYGYLDIEERPWDIRVSSRAEVDKSIVEFKQIIAWIRSERPDMKLGFYDILPFQDFWSPVHYLLAISVQPGDPDYNYLKGNLAEFTASYQAWLQASDYLSPLLPDLDVLFPSVYTFYQEPSGIPSWKIYAKANIEQSLKWGKPVYPFLMPVYHDSNPTLGGQLIPADQMYQQYMAVKSFGAQGLVVWMAGGNGPWHNMPWLDQLQNFINANNINAGLPASVANAIDPDISRLQRMLTWAAIALFALIILLMVIHYRNNVKKK
jgi:peptidoglycan hydrolase-like protein with peptidoglycan-binding domain